ncbi:hypothetical protein OSTOST_12266 [Ostertagia ostertagi]
MGIGPYTTAKFAVTGYCDVIRQEMRLFGVSVHIIEPGFFKTTLISPENVDKQLMSMYESCPDDAKREYGHQFFMEMQEKISWMLDFISSDRIDYVIDAYVHALTAVYPRSRYQVGFIPLSMLPTGIADLIMQVVTVLTGIPNPLALQKKNDKTK